LRLTWIWGARLQYGTLHGPIYKKQNGAQENEPYVRGLEVRADRPLFQLRLEPPWWIYTWNALLLSDDTVSLSFPGALFSGDVILNFPRLYPGPIKSYGKRAWIPWNVSKVRTGLLCHCMIDAKETPRVSRSNFSIIDLTSRPKQTRRAARWMIYPKLISESLSIRDSLSGRTTDEA
jgi:hypothetical protein